ncbi:protein-L-isoaspartate(D-aspartate) O-methyltransferase [Agaribacter marinus]|uniref:Protein-L-isoaspartate O-methyltransferase n=1 Tax=Agaribacter marinus TaxID=1431249 RepID=A0AA37SYN2_9ALTE|nr:protein-L-isoaspartate(D-aspartate) O-methyltransferase [Agaribacter marinus]GLR72552.1 protein-L-isoaspartate O-methyltransferase [Agaribacter marinus]
MNLHATRKGTQLASLLISEGIKHTEVIKVISQTPRDLFVPEGLKHKAYENNALPIGQGQTISQPFTVAHMTEQLLNTPFPVKKVLEIGTGSGYQTAILAQLFPEVYSVERIKSLQFHAKRRMNKLDLHNVKMKHGDGWLGWPSKGPFDAIIVTAAAESVPDALIEQLSEKGRLVVPVGKNQQKLILINKERQAVKRDEIGDVRFVPLVAGALA